jgi:hypothetical protein
VVVAGVVAVVAVAVLVVPSVEVAVLAAVVTAVTQPDCCVVLDVYPVTELKNWQLPVAELKVHAAQA